MLMPQVLYLMSSSNFVLLLSEVMSHVECKGYWSKVRIKGDICGLASSQSEICPHYEGLLFTHLGRLGASILNFVFSLKSLT